MARGAPRALVIDNDQSICDLMQMILGDDGWDVQARSCGHAALELLPHWAPDVILLDLLLMEMETELFLAALREQHRDTPIILVSAVNNLDEYAARLGVKRSLSKPFAVADLTALVSEFVGQERLGSMAPRSSDGG
ncbi:MAG: response regulator [Chloroflexota bacterium]